MNDGTDKDPPNFSQPVRQLIANSSDEQLTWMVGPDRRFYSSEALDAAAFELESRRANAPDEPERPPFNSAAFVLGPAWYFHHGMFGRGSMLMALLVGAFFGLRPVAEAVGVPLTVWVVLVLFAVGAYCGRYGTRDLEESRTQRKLTPRKGGKNKQQPPKTAEKPDYVVAAKLGCDLAGEQATNLLAAAGIKATIKSDGPPLKDGETTSSARLLVPRADKEKAHKLLSVLLKHAK